MATPLPSDLEIARATPLRPIAEVAAAAHLPAGLRTSDGGRLEIIQQRIRILVGEGGSGKKR